MASKLNRPIEDYLHHLQNEYARTHLIPSYSRLMTVFRVRSKNTVGLVMTKLEKNGYVERDAETSGFTRWLPSRRFFAMPLTGSSVPAGRPVLVDDLVKEAITLDEFLVKNPMVTERVVIKDDAMTGASIQQGDIALVEVGRQPKVGDIVLISLNGESTLRYLVKQGRQHVLRSANSDYPDLRPGPSHAIRGVMVGLVRKIV